ncbi:DUF2730 domain-containing protein [uncultured Pseudomonas sp.]|uniref:DUF2730 domain-containing protein n=1 Tax=uncultured Pseudomonas sp. TaxID=114707 RepID=UPI0030D799BA|tara:strand:- start:771 stop:1073 length:303 start_codon:yes stop_codon:yes gene_type:complete
MGTEEIRLAFTIGQWLIMGGVGIYAYLTSRDAANASDLVDLRTRVVTLEEQMKHQPDQTLVNALHADMKGVQARLDGIQQSLAPLASQLDRINNYLLTNK